MLKNNKNTLDFLHGSLYTLIQIPVQIFRSHRGNLVSPSCHLLQGKTTKNCVFYHCMRCTALIMMFNVCRQCLLIGVQRAVLRITNPPTHSCGRWIKHRSHNFTRGNDEEAVKSEEDLIEFGCLSSSGSCKYLSQSQSEFAELYSRPFTSLAVLCTSGSHCPKACLLVQNKAG